MVKQIKIRENQKEIILNDDGNNLVIYCSDGVFNVNKKELMELLNKENKTYQDIQKEREK